MMTPKLVEDFSSYIGKDYVLNQNVTNCSWELAKGIKFKIKSINKGRVKIKILSKFEDFNDTLNLLFKRLIASSEKERRAFQKIVDLWEKDPTAFTKHPSQLSEESKGGRLINTGYPIPLSYPKKDGTNPESDTVYTFEYKHKSIPNEWSYQKVLGCLYYDKATYEFFVKREELNIANMKNHDPKTMKRWYGVYLKDQELDLNKFKKIDFSKI